MSKTAEKLNAALGVSRAAKTAETVEDFQRVVDRLRSDLIAKTVQVLDLEQQRDTILLDGKDEVAFYARWRETREQRETLKLNLASAERRRDEAHAAKEKADVETSAYDAEKVHGEALMAAIRRLHAATGSVLQYCAEVLDHRRAIEWHNEVARKNERPDLIVSAEQFSIRAAAEVDDRGVTPQPERTSSESDEAFSLRLQNWAAMQNGRESVIVAQARLARAALDEALEVRGAHEQARNGIETTIMNFKSPLDGQPIRKIVATNRDGRMADPLASPTVAPETRRAEYDRS